MEHLKKMTESASCRMDLAGGTVDLWPLYLYLGGLELVNMSINVSAKVELKWQPKKSHVFHIESADLNLEKSYESLEDLQASLKASSHENKLRWVNRVVADFMSENPSRSRGEWWIKTSSEAPPGSGLGGSSTLGIALARAFLRAFGKAPKSVPLKWALQQRVRDLEAVEIEHPAGDQDYVPALFGGLLIFKLGTHSRSVEKLPLSLAKKLSAQTALIYTGKPHHSGLNNWSIFKAFHEGDSQVRKSLKEIAAISRAMAEELRKSTLNSVASLINQEWEERLKLSPAVGAQELDEAWAFAKGQGATARKACGAGGGGCLLVFFPDKKSKALAVAQELPNADWRWLSTDVV